MPDLASPSLSPAMLARRQRWGLPLGALGVLIFAFSIPMTRLAAGPASAPQLDPVFVALGRAGVAGLLSLAWLLLTRAPWPTRAQVQQLAGTAAGIVFGWPLLLGWAVREVDAAHAAVVSGLLPLATAAVGAWLMRLRPPPVFWACALAGAGLVLGFAAWRGAGAPQAADAWLAGAVLAASTGYVLGAGLQRGPGALSAEQVICWVLVLSLPLTLPVLWLRWPAHPVAASAWWGFAYVAVFSMWLGFFAWYRGLAWGGTLRVSQLQLLQPFGSLLLAVPLLGERLDAATLAFAATVLGVVALGRRLANPAAAPAPGGIR